MKKMKKKKVVIGLLAVFVVALVAGLCLRPSVRLQSKQDGATEEFAIDTLLPVTPVKTQGRSSLCWVYAMLATMETDRLAQGDSVNLSPVYVARQFLERQARRYYLSHGKTSLSLRGMMTMTLKVMEKTGLQPYDYYRKCNDADWNALQRRVKQLADAALSRREDVGAFEQQLNDLLDQELDFEPRYVHMLGAEYTNEEFGRSVAMPGDWVAMTSFSHHAFGDSFVLEVADNQFRDRFLNVPLDTLVETVRQSLLSGHPVCWEGDITERGFSFEKGVATIDLPATAQKTDGSTGSGLQTVRQRWFEHSQTTDDHCMALVGLAHDRQGRRYYVAKNSWGKGNPFGGLMFLSEDYLRMKTIAVVVRSDVAGRTPQPAL